MFINSKSGGNQGVELLSAFRRHLNPYQVWDLSIGSPIPGLWTFRHMSKFRILIGGGDGTFGWVLGALQDMKNYLAFKEPPSALLPLGTGTTLHMHTGTHASGQTQRHRCTQAQTHRRKHTGTNTQTHATNTHTYTGMLHMCTHTTHAHTMHAHTGTHAHTHTRTHTPFPPPPTDPVVCSGNDLARALNWGGGYNGQKVMQILLSLEQANITALDRYTHSCSQAWT